MRNLNEMIITLLGFETTHSCEMIQYLAGSHISTEATSLEN